MTRTETIARLRAIAKSCQEVADDLAHEALQEAQAAPGRAPAPQTAPRATPAAKRVQAAFQGGADFPEVGTVVPLPHPVTIQHRDGDLAGVRNGKIHFPPHAVPEIGGKVNPRPYFTTSATLPATLWPLYEKYARTTWGELYAEALAGDPEGLRFITRDKFWSVATFQGKRTPGKLWQQAAALAVLAQQHAAEAADAAAEANTDGDADPEAEAKAMADFGS